MITTPARQAIYCALNNDWETALELNLNILKETPDDLQAILRTAKAHFHLGNNKKALQFARKALSLDPTNTIATRCLEKWQASQHTPQNKNSHKNVGHFLEEPGRTKIIPLIHLADHKTLSTIDCGQCVNIHAQKHKITVSSAAGDYIGRLADDVASIIHYALEKGHEFDVFIKSIAKDEVKIFMKETRGAKVFSKAI